LLGRRLGEKNTDRFVEVREMATRKQSQAAKRNIKKLEAIRKAG
jgi:hypothetical protein